MSDLSEQPAARPRRHEPRMAVVSLKGYAVLRNRNYRLFWLGQWISLIGTWMQSVTQAWLLARLTDNPLALGLLGVGAWRYGLLMAAAGVGAGTGGFLLAGQRLQVVAYRRLLPISLLGFSVALSAFALSRNYTASLFLLAGVGCSGLLYFNASNTLVQLGVEDAVRGRVMSLYTLMHQGTATFGSLVLGVRNDTAPPWRW